MLQRIQKTCIVRRIPRGEQGHVPRGESLSVNAARLQLTREGKFRCIASAQMQKLMDRQWDVLLNIAEGRRVSEVAEALSISQKAVESHKYRIMRAIGANDPRGSVPLGHS